MSQILPNLDYLADYNKTLIVLSSADKTSNSASNTDFSISFNSNGQALNKVKKISLSNFSCNNLFYNVASYSNIMELYYYPLAVETRLFIVVPVGYYNATTLCAYIQAFVRANTSMAGFTCVFDTTTYYVTMSSNDPMSPINIGAGIINPSFRRRYEGTLAWNLGYTEVPYGISESLTAQSYPSLNLQNVYLYSTKIGSVKSYMSNGIGQSTVSNQILSIPLNTTPYGGTVSWISSGSNQRGDLFYSVEQQLDTLDFQLRNEWGNVLETQANNFINLEFLVYY